MIHLLIFAVPIQTVKRKEPKSPNVYSNFAKSFLSQFRCQTPNKGVLKWLTIVKIHINGNFQQLIILIYTTKVKCSYSLPKFKPSRHNFSHIERKYNRKTQANVKLFLATGFEFEHDLIALYFTALTVDTVMFVVNLIQT